MPARPLRSFLSIASAALVALTARASLADHYRVPSGSMDPTVHVGDRIVVAKVAYGLRVPFTERYAVTFAPPARGDVVVLEPPDEADVGTRADLLGSVLLKRVVARAGETVLVKDGRVFLDGRLVEEPWGFVPTARVLGRALGVFARDGRITYAPL